MSSRVTLRGSNRNHLSQSIRIGRPKPNDKLEVTLVLRRKQDAPHPWQADRYHTHEELEQFYGADPADVAAVEAVAAENHLTISHMDAASRTISLIGPFGDVARVFGADVEMHRIANKTFRSRRGPLSLPAELAGRVTAVLGFDTRPLASSAVTFKPHNANDVSYTPRQIAELYNFPKATGKGQTIAIIELGGGYRSRDLSAYWKKLGIKGPAVNAIAVSGTHNRPVGNPDSADGEVVLDIEVAGAVAPQAKLAVYFAPNTDQGFFKAINAAIHDRTRQPSVISISWGSAESQWTRQSLDAFNQAFHDAALLGITVFAAAGDDGSSDGENDGKAHVDFPASSPWVVACGGTSLESVNGKITKETVWNDGAQGGSTGGGVSTFFALPGYQLRAGVPLSTVRPNFAGRGVPDIAGCADPNTGYQVLVDGTEGVVGGTSAVAPLWSGLTALLNEELGTRVGFLHPLLYGTFAEHKAFNDIHSGTNGDFSAKPSWDACTGMGTPNGQTMLDILKEIQRKQVEE